MLCEVWPWYTVSKSKFTLLLIILCFTNPEKDSFWKHCGKEENAGHQHFLYFSPQCFVLLQGQKTCELKDLKFCKVSCALTLWPSPGEAETCTYKRHEYNWIARATWMETSLKSSNTFIFQLWVYSISHKYFTMCVISKTI